MLFKRKHPANWQERLRVAVWPRRNWTRSTKYIAKRVLRLTASPHAIAAGIAAGVFASCTPFLGLHFIIAFVVAYLIAGNFIAAAAGTFFGNPLSFPFIWGATYTTGNFILGSAAQRDGHSQLQQLMHSDFWHLGVSGIKDLLIGIWEPVLKPMLVGSIPIGIALGIVFYILTRWAAVAFQINRRHRLAAKAREMKARAMARFEHDETEGASKT